MAKESIFGLPENLPKKEEPPKPAIPQELQGKSPEEIYKMLQEEHNRVVSQLDLQHQLDIEKAKGVAPKPQPPQGQQLRPPYMPPGMGQQQEDEIDLISQPEQYLDRAFRQRMGPLVQTWVGSARNQNRALFIQQIGKEEYEKYKDNLEGFVDRLAPEIQVNPESYHAAYKVARGDNVDAIADERAEKKAEEIVKKVLTNLGINPELAAGAVQGKPPVQGRPTSSLFQGPTGTIPHTETPRAYSPQAEETRVNLTPLQKELAKKFGMTEEEYAEYAKFNTDLVSELGRGK